MTTEIITLTPADVSRLTVPGDWPGLLDGYCGPVEVQEIGEDEWKPATLCGSFWYAITNGPNEGELGNRGSVAAVRLPLSHPEARYRLACWLAEGGALCTACGENESDTDVCPAAWREGGYLRAPFTGVWDFLSPGPSEIPEWVMTTCLWASAVRVVGGQAAIICAAMHGGTGPGSFIYAYDWDDCGSGISLGGRYNTATKVLAAGYALLDGETLRVQVPEAAITTPYRENT